MKEKREKSRLTADKTTREQRGQRRKWRTQQRKCRQNKINIHRNLTPPSIPTAKQPVAVLPMPVVKPSSHYNNFSVTSSSDELAGKLRGSYGLVTNF